MLESKSKGVTLLHPFGGVNLIKLWLGTHNPCKHVISLNIIHDLQWLILIFALMIMAQFTNMAMQSKVAILDI